MTHPRSHKHPEELSDELRVKQENILWPNTVRNGRSVDALIWKGSPEATLVQRIGIWLFGLAFFAVGLEMLSWARRAGSRPLGYFSCLWLLLGIKVTLNAFRRHRGNVVRGSDNAGPRP